MWGFLRIFLDPGTETTSLSAGIRGSGGPGSGSRGSTQEYHHRPKRIRLCFLCHTTCQGSSVFSMDFPGSLNRWQVTYNHPIGNI